MENCMCLGITVFMFINIYMRNNYIYADKKYVLLKKYKCVYIFDKHIINLFLFVYLFMYICI